MSLKPTKEILEKVQKAVTGVVGELLTAEIEVAVHDVEGLPYVTVVLRAVNQADEVVAESDIGGVRLTEGASVNIVLPDLKIPGSSFFSFDSSVDCHRWPL